MSDCNTCQPLTKVLNPSMPQDYRQFMIEQKAAQYRATATQSAMPMTKSVRAIFDPNLGPSGGYRCPVGTQFGGQVTDRFGRNCGRGILRRVGRGLMGMGQRLDNLAERRDRGRLDRAVRRRQRPNGVARAANALERGAQRLVGAYKPSDYKPGDGGRRSRRNLPGEAPNRLSVVPRKPKRRRLVPDGAERKPRTQGANPKERRLRERAAEGLERAARRVLGEEDRKPRTRGRSVVDADQPSAKPSVKPSAKPSTPKDGYDWDALSDEQQDAVKEIQYDALDALREERAKLMKRPADKITGEQFEQWIEGKRNHKDYEKYQAMRKKINQLEVDMFDRPEEAINEVDWTPEERRKLDAIFNKAPSAKPKADDKDRFDLDQLNTAQKKQVQDIASDALDSLERKMRDYMGLDDDEFIDQDLVDNFLRRKKNNKLIREYEDDAYKWNQLHTSWNDDPERAINEINWTLEERRKIQSVFDKKPSAKPDSNDFWQRRKNRPPKFVPPSDDSDPSVVSEIVSSRPDGVPSEDREAERNFIRDMIKRNRDDEDYLIAVRKSFEGNLASLLAKNNDNDPLAVEKARDYQDYINLIDQNLNALKARRERAKRTPTPAPKLTVSAPVRRVSRKPLQNQKKNVIKALDVDDITNEENNKRVGAFADEPEGFAELPKPERIVNPEINNLDDAIKWLQDGKPLNEVPEDYWWDAIEEAPERFRRLTKQGGAIKGVKIYEALDDDGNPTGTGVVFNYDYDLQNHYGEPIVQNLMHALGMNVAPARWDGRFADGEQRVNAMPFAWNRAPVGERQVPNLNYSPELFDDLPDKGFPERLGHYLGNFMAQIADRHRNNGMAAKINGRAHIVPIDFGFIEKDFRNLDEYYFTMDSSLLFEIRDELEKRTPSERVELQQKAVEVYDGMLVRGKAIVARGREQFIKDATSGLFENADSFAKARAGKQFDALAKAVADLEERRSGIFLDRFLLDDVPPLPSAPESRRTPSVPAPQQNQSVGMGRVIKALNVATPRKKDKRVPLLANMVDGEPLPQAKPIVNDKIKTRQDAVKWLDDGNLIDEVPNEFWAYALNMHVNGNAPNKQYMEIVPDTGIMKTVRIYQAIEDNGNPIGQGFVIQYEGGAGKAGVRPENNMTEVLAVNLFNALGLNMEPAMFDGEAPDGYPIAVIPYAWNRAPEGGVIVPRRDEGYGVPNFSPEQLGYQRLNDQAFPQRIAALFANWIIKNPDRHDQNQMGGRVGDVPHVVPIDLGWAGDAGWSGQALDDYFESEWALDADLLFDIEQHFGDLSEGERDQQAEAILDMLDGMSANMRKILDAGEKAYVDNALSLLGSLADDDEVARVTRRKAREIFKMLEASYQQFGNARQYIEEAMLA